MEDVIQLLRQAAIFKELDDGELARVAEVCRMQDFVSGEYVFREGEPGNRLFLIVEGDVRISRTIPGSGEEALAVLKPGSLFGEMSARRRDRAGWRRRDRVGSPRWDRVGSPRCDRVGSVLEPTGWILSA